MITRSALIAVAFAAALGSPCAADQLIQIPTADRVTAPTLEYKQRVEGRDEGYGTLLVPAGLAYELMFRYYNDLDREHGIEGGGQFQLLPDGIVTPAVAMGLWDLTNSGPWGRRGFLVITKSLGPGQLGIPRFFERVQLTIGTGTGRFSGFLGALRVDLPGRFTLIGEYDARRFNAGLWFSPLKPLTLKAELQNGDPYLGGELRLRF